MNDQVFIRYLSEIEKSYLILPKALRIRVERWVEKLVSIGNNELWKKNRNAYAKLLLNMIIIRNLENPFHTMPPDGDLPAFPSYLKAINKNSLGIHESSFWRDLYTKVQDKSFDFIESKRNIHDLSQSYYHDNIITNNNTTARYSSPPLKSMQNITSPERNISSPILHQLPLSREISNLNLLIKEQSYRIKLLEEQLTEERMKNELHIQRLHYGHRLELAKHKAELEHFISVTSMNNIINNTTNTTLNHQNDMINNSKQDISPLKAYSTTTTHDIADPNTSNSYNNSNMIMLNDNNSIDNDYYNNQSNINNNNNNVLDIAPNPKRTYFETTNNTVTNSSTTNNTATYSNNNSRSNSPIKNNFLFNRPLIHKDDTAFLKYIDNFQSEIKRINDSIILTSPERF